MISPRARLIFAWCSLLNIFCAHPTRRACMRPTTHNFDLSSLITATETIYFTLHEPLPHLIHCRSDSSTNLCTISKLFNRRSTIFSFSVFNIDLYKYVILVHFLLHCALSCAVYCNRPCLCVCLFVCLFVSPPYCSQRAVFASPWALFSFTACYTKYFVNKVKVQSCKLIKTDSLHRPATGCGLLIASKCWVGG